MPSIEPLPTATLVAIGALLAEEAFFRGFLQREVEHALDGRPHAAAIAVAASAILFGLAHAAGGWHYVLLATLPAQAMPWPISARAASRRPSSPTSP